MAEITTIARPYAQAVFELAQAQGDFAGWSETVQLLATIAVDPQAAELLDSPRTTGDQKSSLLLEVAGDKINAGGKNLIKVLAANHRLDAMAEIARLFEIMRNDAEGAIEAELITAMPVSEQQQREVAAALKARLGRDIHLECKVNPALLGGAVIRAGDLVIDGSAKGKLEQLANALIH